MARKPKLVWDEWNKEHIKKHKVTVNEVEEAYRGETLVAQARGKRQMILGKTKNGRRITVFVSFEKQPEPYVVSARDISKKERSIVYEKTNESKSS